jgi:hypothetical protein
MTFLADSTNQYLCTFILSFVFLLIVGALITCFDGFNRLWTNIAVSTRRIIIFFTAHTYPNNAFTIRATFDTIIIHQITFGKLKECLPIALTLLKFCLYKEFDNYFFTFSSVNLTNHNIWYSNIFS